MKMFESECALTPLFEIFHFLRELTPILSRPFPSSSNSPSYEHIWIVLLKKKQQPEKKKNPHLLWPSSFWTRFWKSSLYSCFYFFISHSFFDVQRASVPIRPAWGSPLKSLRSPCFPDPVETSLFYLTSFRAVGAQVLALSSQGFCALPPDSLSLASISLRVL